MIPATGFPRMFRASAPGCVCPVGEYHQYFGLDMLGMAVDRRFEIQATERKDKRYTFRADGEHDLLAVASFQDLKEKGAYPEATYAAQALRSAGLKLAGGYDFVITSEIPEGGGLQESAAALVAWITALFCAAGSLKERSGKEIAELAARARPTLPGGTPRPAYELVSCLGGAVYVQWENGPQGTLLRSKLGSFIVAPLRGRHDDTNTWGLRTAPRGGAEEVPSTAPPIMLERFSRAIEDMIQVHPSFDIRNTKLDEIVPLLSQLEGDAGQTIYAMLVGRDLCREALKTLARNVLDDDVLGELMDREHEMLRDHLKLSNERAEKARDVAKTAGALGCKIAAGGNNMLVFAPGREDAVGDALKKASLETYRVQESDGMRLEF